MTFLSPRILIAIHNAVPSSTFKILLCDSGVGAGYFGESHITHAVTRLILSRWGLAHSNLYIELKGLPHTAAVAACQEKPKVERYSHNRLKANILLRIVCTNCSTKTHSLKLTNEKKIIYQAGSRCDNRVKQYKRRDVWLQ